jgi:Cysteine dioxygenase type I
MQFATDERFAHIDDSRSIQSNAVSKTSEQLATIVAKFASSNEWIDQVRLSVDRRWYQRLFIGPDHDIWVISWLPGQSTGFHDLEAAPV